MDDGVLKGVEIISLIGDYGGKIDYATLVSNLESEDLEELVGSLCKLGAVKREENEFCLTANGQKIYEKLQKQYI